MRFSKHERRGILKQVIKDKRMDVSTVLWLLSMLVYCTETLYPKLSAMFRRDIKYIQRRHDVVHQTGGFDKKSAKYPRKYSKTYCVQTPCDKMGFSQKASCRPYKNCYKK